jgi:hypothetical protein
MRQIKLAVFLLGAILLAGCSSGGGGGDNDASESNTWDEMIWDQGTWS